MIEVPYIELNNGRFMPALGFGTFRSGPGEVEKAVEWAIDAGYRLIDTAYVYGNEREIGTAVRNKIKQGVIKREDMFIVTKLWIAFMTMEAAIKMCKQSSDTLGLGYIDLFLIHAPMATRDNSTGVTGHYLDAWKGLEQCVQQGIVKSIGVSNFNSHQISNLISKANILPVANQIECNTHMNNLKLIQFCRKNDMVLLGHTPFGKPSDSGFGTRSHLSDAGVSAIAKKYRKTPGQVLLRFLIQIEVCPLPKSVQLNRIQENIDVFNFSLEETDMEYLKSLNTNTRRVIWAPFVGHADYPFKTEF